ncbi:MAG TPA: hypothetical protein PKA31_02970 [Candidatus Moranbacteria bacterium]|nr:hypothetical protein [Candidatus Moranbacteria bacterium]
MTHKSEELDLEKARKIDALRDMISNAEKTIQGAKAMLLQLEGKKKAGRKRKYESEEEGTVVEGTFDGQIMIGADGKQYPVPANYASKSKLVEGDMLKLTITPDGSFIYKQIGPIERKHLIGMVTQDERGNFHIFAEGRPYKVLLASITYFRVQPGDEVALVVPRDMDASWAAIENVLQKAPNINLSAELEVPSPKSNIGEDGKFAVWETRAENSAAEGDDSAADEWADDLEDLEEELARERAAQNTQTA